MEPKGLVELFDGVKKTGNAITLYINDPIGGYSIEKGEVHRVLFGAYPGKRYLIYLFDIGSIRFNKYKPNESENSVSLYNGRVPVGRIFCNGMLYSYLPYKPSRKRGDPIEIAEDKTRHETHSNPEVVKWKKKNTNKFWIDLNKFLYAWKMWKENR